MSVWCACYLQKVVKTNVNKLFAILSGGRAQRAARAELQTRAIYV